MEFLNNVNLDVMGLNIVDIDIHGEPVPFFFDQVLDGVLDLEEEHAVQERENAALADLLQDNDDYDEDDGYFTDPDDTIDIMDMDIDLAEVAPEPGSDDDAEDIPPPVDVDSDAETIENVRDIDENDINYDPAMDINSDDDNNDNSDDDIDVEEAVKCEVVMRKLLKVRKSYFRSAKKLVDLKIKTEERKIRARLARIQRRVRRNKYRLNDVPRRRYDMCFGCGKAFWLQRTRCWIRCIACGNWLCPDCNEEEVLHCQADRDLFRG